MEIAHQKARLAPLRDFAVADSLLRQATKLALQATQEGNRRRDSLRRLVATEVDVLEQELDAWRASVTESLAAGRFKQHLVTAELRLATASRLAEQEEFDLAQAELRAGRSALESLGSGLASYAVEEAEEIDLWRRWVSETVEASRQKGDHAIIVDKSAHRAYLVKGGRQVHAYACELGYHPARQKQFAGDAATPEGKYRIVSARANGSKYHKALLLDYPNARDRARFQDNKARGRIPPNVRIGGLIEIHGEGGRGRDWTEGCVALTNADMDHLMQYVGEGTPVTIVRRSDRWP